MRSDPLFRVATENSDSPPTYIAWRTKAANVYLLFILVSTVVAVDLQLNDLLVSEGS